MGKGLAAGIVQALGEQRRDGARHASRHHRHAAPGSAARRLTQAARRNRRRSRAAGLAHPLWPVLTSMPGSRRQDRRQTPHRGRAQSLRFGRSPGGLRWPRTSYPALRLIYPWRASVQARQQGTQASLVPIAFAALRDPPIRERITHGRSSTASDITRHSSRWHGDAVMSCSPCCAMAPFTNPSQPLRLDELHTGTHPHMMACRNRPRNSRIGLTFQGEPEKKAVPGVWTAGQRRFGLRMPVHCGRPHDHFRTFNLPSIALLAAIRSRYKHLSCGLA
ncbi:hypothetical protein QF001_000114 [Paraburkholderia youngii]